MISYPNILVFLVRLITFSLAVDSAELPVENSIGYQGNLVYPSAHLASSLRWVGYLPVGESDRVSNDVLPVDYTHGLRDSELWEFTLGGSDVQNIFISRRLLNEVSNVSKNDSTPKTTLLSNAVKITFTVGYTVCFLIGFTGNLLILVAIKNNKQLHNDINYLLCNVAITDILRMIVLISYELFVIHVNGNPDIDIPALPGVPGDVLCKAMWTLPKLFVYVFTYTLVFMTVERFVAVVFPFSTFIFKRKSKCLITAIWTSSIVLSLPDLYATKSMMKNSKPVCETDFTPFSYSSGKAQWDAYLKALAVYVSTAYVIPLLIVLLLHVVMSCVLSRHRNDSLLTASNISSSTRRVVSMLGTMSVVFALTSIPIQFFYFSYICDAEWIITTLPVYVTFLLMFVSQLSSMFNPWIYPLYVKSFHNEYSKLLGKVFLAKKNRCESLSHDGTTVKRLTSWSNNTRPDVKETCI